MTAEHIPAEEAPKKLAFGLDHGHPTAWGARGILQYHKYVDVPFDRKSGRGPRLKELCQKLDAGPYTAALEAGKDLHPREETGDVELYRGEGVVIIGNTHASCGYLYIGAWLEEED